MKGLFFIVLSSLFVFACKSTQQSTSNLASIYRENDNYFVRDYRFYNCNDSISEINFTVNQNKLLFVKLVDTKVFSAHYEISYIVYSDYDNGLVLDSTTLEFSVNKEEAISNKIHQIKFIAPEGKNYFVEIITRDLQRNSNFSFLGELNKKTKHDKHYYLVQQKEKNIGNSFVVDTGEVCIENHKLSSDTLTVRCFYRSFHAPLPPFDLGIPNVFNRTPDSIYNITTDNTGHFSLNIKQHGFYIIQKDSSAENNLCLMNFNSGYPFIVHQQQMLDGLAYLCERKEFEKLKNATNAKEAINKFWLANCGSEENAKEHIRQFYLRTEVANKFFSSYREGWCTDRGMIFIIFGSPRYIFRSETTERWVYGDNNSVMSEDFIFRKINNPYSSNAYALERSSSYKNTWYKIIEAWRDGRLF